MDTRERFLEVMKFNTGVRSLKWEFGYWGQTLNNWYASGLPRKAYIDIPSEIVTPTSGLYTTVWSFLPKGDLPKGYPAMGGGLYWPTQGFALDHDVKDYFGMDEVQRLVDVNLLLHPMFEPKILEEDEKYIVYIDVDGVKRRFIKETATMPASEAFPIKDRRSWEKIKAERINFEDVSGRFPPNWNELVKEYRNRTYPLALGGYPHGFFGTPAHLMGYANLFYNYYDDPGLIHDIVSTFTDLWIAVYDEVLKDVDVDHVQIWEDISFGKGPMVSPAMIKEFMVPYYKRFTDFVRGRGIEVILVDTDGYCFDIIPLFIEGGVTGMYPIEVSCGMDLMKVRMTFPRLKLMGGIPKLEIAKGKKRIDKILEPVKKMLKFGGYIPFGDHLIPPEVHWKEFKYYRETLNRMLEKK